MQWSSGRDISLNNAINNFNLFLKFSINFRKLFGILSQW